MLQNYINIVVLRYASTLTNKRMCVCVCVCILVSVHLYFSCDITQLDLGFFSTGLPAYLLSGNLLLANATVDDCQAVMYD